MSWPSISVVNCGYAFSRASTARQSNVVRQYVGERRGRRAGHAVRRRRRAARRASGRGRSRSAGRRGRPAGCRCVNGRIAVRHDAPSERNASFRLNIAERNNPFQCYPEPMPNPRQPAARPAAGRQAARNDAVILEAAREVFLADPKAPIAAVAERAGVGISALYRRYPARRTLLRTLCHDGLRRYIAEAEAAAGRPGRLGGFVGFLERVVDADVHSLTVHLAGTFAPTEEMGRDAVRANELAAALFDRAPVAGGSGRTW